MVRRLSLAHFILALELGIIAFTVLASRPIPIELTVMETLCSGGEDAGARVRDNLYRVPSGMCYDSVKWKLGEDFESNHREAVDEGRLFTVFRIPDDRFLILAFDRPADARRERLTQISMGHSAEPDSHTQTGLWQSLMDLYRVEMCRDAVLPEMPRPPKGDYLYRGHQEAGSPIWQD
jgi:hypothetical protein